MRPKPSYQPGDRIGGRYLVHQALMGGMGEVYLCLDLETNVPLALKTFQQRYLSIQLRDAFYGEVSNWVALENHPNIVHCFLMETIGNQPFMFLEWVVGEEGHGTDLRKWLRRGPLSLRLALDFTVDICRGLSHAQQKVPHLVHRDLKPDNILIAQGRVAKITDFGLATVAEKANLALSEEDGIFDSRRTIGIGRIVGTPAYMSPEQWLGEDLDERIDIYAIGCILYELITGESLFPARSVGEMRHHHLESPAPSFPSNIPNALNDVLQRSTAKLPDMRFTCVEDLVAAVIRVYETTFGQPPRELVVQGKFRALDYNNRGYTYHQLGQYDNALRDLTRAIELDSTLSMAYVNRGNVYQKLQRHDQALSDYSQALELDSGDAHAYANRGMTYHALGRTQLALEDYACAIRIKPDDPKLHVNRGRIYFESGGADKAMADYNRAIKLDPQMAEAYSNIGNVFYSQKQFDKALIHHTRAIELAPMLAECYINRAAVYVELSQYDKALADYNRAIELDHTNILAYSLRGTSYFNVHQHDEALADFLHVIELDPASAEAHSKVGGIYCLREDYQKALPYLTKGAELGNPEAMQLASQVMMKIGLEGFQSANSREAMGRTVTEYPFMVDPKVGFIEAIEQIIEQKIPLQHRPPFEKRLSWLRQIAEKITTLDRMLQQRIGELEQPQARDDYYALGIIHTELAQYEKALDDFSRAIELDSTDARAYLLRSRIYFLLKSYPNGMSDAEKAVQLDPALANNVAESYFIAASTLVNEGKVEEALVYSEKAAQLGHKRAERLVIQLRQRLALDPDSPAYRIQLAFEAFGRTGSINEMRQAIADHPVITEPETIHIFEHTVAEMENASRKEEFSQRLMWLRELTGRIQREFAEGLQLFQEGKLREAVPIFERLAHLYNLPEAARSVTEIKKILADSGHMELFLETQQALRAFMESTSVEEMSKLTEQFPFMTDPDDFMAFLEQDLAAQLPPEMKPAFEQRLAWLRQIANEQK